MQFVINNFEGGTTDAISPVIAFRTDFPTIHEVSSIKSMQNIEMHIEIISNKSFVETYLLF